MIKRTLYISSPCHLSVKNRQLVISPGDKNREERSVPVEDIGFVILENHSITLTIKLVELLNENNAAVIFCNSQHMPCSMLQNFSGHTTHAENLKAQIETTVPLKKRLWAITVKAKIRNQAGLLQKAGKTEYIQLQKMADSVKSGDIDNREGTAARIYWRALLGDEFKRERFGEYPNNIANYGYAVLRAAIARALAGTGLYPAIGIHHHNRYNAFALADDVIEPYRPFVDEIVYKHYNHSNEKTELTVEEKKAILTVLTCDVCFGKKRCPLMLGISKTTASLAKCFLDKKLELIYPDFS